jgi:translation elongation factor P/translation initiation factor 5A
MKAEKLQSFGWSLLTAAFAFALSSCSCTPKTAEVHKTTMVAVQPGVPGGTTLETYQSSAIVTAIDAANRLVTVVSPNGATATFKAGTNVVNFDQIHIGDQIRATLTKEVVVFLRPADEPATDGGASAIALAAKGQKPGVAMADTVEVTATVEAVDLKRHEATLLFPDGTTKTFPVRPDVDLTKAKLGQQVVIRSTRSIAFLVEKP